MVQNPTEIGDQNCGRLLNLRSHSTQAYEMRPAHKLRQIMTTGASGRLTDSLVVYPEHHFLDAVDQSLDGA